MHCWKSIDIIRNGEFYRKFLISAIISLSVFIFLYIPINLMYVEQLHDDYFYLLLIGILLIYPVHKVTHIFPLLRHRKHLSFELTRYFYILPVMQVKIEEPIKKMTFVRSLLYPFIFINMLLIIGGFLFPYYIHYFIILIAYHTGICTNDFIYVKHLLLAPKNSYIEESDQAYKILLKE